jgi:hypothetical protein
MTTPEPKIIVAVFSIGVFVAVCFDLLLCQESPTNLLVTSKTSTLPLIEKEAVCENSHFSQQLAESRSTQKASVGQPVLGGLLGAAVGFFGGAFIGSSLFGQRGYDAAGGAYVGAIVGEALVMPLGVHQGNRRRGKLWLDMLTSIGISAAGVLHIHRLEIDEAWLITVPILQIGATVAMERSAIHQQ